MEFSLLLFIFPPVVVIISIIGFLLVRKWLVMPSLTFAVFAFLMLTVFNITFLIWLILYTILSIAVSFPMKFLRILSKYHLTALITSLLWIFHTKPQIKKQGYSKIALPFLFLGLPE